MSIPVIGVPIVNGVHWLQRLIDSVDYPVDTFFILNNNGKGEIDAELDAIAAVPHPFIKKIHVSHFPSNQGVPASFNLTIKCFINAPYWVLANYDLAFTPGLLEELASKIEIPQVGMVHGNSGDFGDGAYDLFAIKDFVIQKIGLFDENCYPAYCEDADYIMRLTRWYWDRPDDPIYRITSLDKPYYHGNALTTETNYYQEAGQTKKSDEALHARLDEVHYINWEYMTQKWTEHWRGTNPQKYPLGIEGMPITYTSFDLEYARRKYLGF